MQYTSYLIIFVVLCCVLTFSGNLFVYHSSAQSKATDPLTQGWLDFTSLVTDVSAFIIIGFVGYIATRVNSWIKGNKEWKISIEKNFTDLNHRMKSQEDETKGNVSKLNTAVELLINNFDTYKIMQERELTEIANDYDSLSTFVTENKVEIKQIKEDLRDVKQDVKRIK
jgi:hypothetical protein